MLIRVGDVIYWSTVIGAVLWLGVGIWVYNVDPNPPSEATFVLLMFIGSAILIYVAGWCVRSFPERRTSLDAKSQQTARTSYGLARELDATDEQLVPPLRSHLPEGLISLKPTWKASAQNAIEKINNPAAKRRSDRTLWNNSSS